ncbi:MAG: ATP-dependent helicase [Actinomycetota bacterium]
MHPQDIFAGLNEQQATAVATTRGPVCILAGAGTGKTTTITRRIANQVATGAFAAGSIMAVTFTDKAAAEMRARIERLGVPGVRARTFHAAALAQLRHLSPEPPGRILASKGVAVRQIANRLPKPYRFRPAADLATEIEWARNRRITPDRYVDSLGAHEPPIPADLMQRVYREYERGKLQRGLIDFEDLLELTIRMFESDEDARDIFMARYQAFTVDEFQDVNLLQHRLLELWLGGRDDLCVVGDDYQSIYGFTGASAHYLLEMPKRFHRTTVVKLEENHRSTEPILHMANRLVPAMGGTEKVLKSVKGTGPAVETKGFFDPARETEHLIARIRELHSEGIAYEEMAILYRANFRSEDYEEALTEAGVPFQVKGGAFLSRRAARQMFAGIRNRSSTDVVAEVRAAAGRAGYVEDPPEGLGEQELTRQNDLDRFIRMAGSFEDGQRSVEDFMADVKARFGGEGDAHGVNLSTYHRAKGLEFEAVFLPRLEEGELPFKRSKTDQAIAEERRLFYVGITRAKTHLSITWGLGQKAKASRFLAELGVGSPGVSKGSKPAERPATVLDGEDRAIFEALRKWRLQRADKDSVPAFVVFSDAVLVDIATKRPRGMRELGLISGIGMSKLERYGSEVLEVLGEAAVRA